MMKNRKRIILILLGAMMLTGCATPSADKEDSGLTEQKKTEEQLNSKVENSQSSDTTSSKTSPPLGSESNSDEQNESVTADENEIVDTGETADASAQPQSTNSIRLDVPQFAQETNYYCAVACLQMVLAYHGIEESQDTLAAGLKTSPVTGTEYADLAREASIYIFGKAPENDIEPGYRSLIWNRNEGTDQMKEQFFTRTNTDLRSGDPVFVSVNPAIAYEGKGDAVHEMVLYGADYDEQGRAIHYYCIDPYYHDAEFGGKKVFTADELWTAMNNNPEPGYVW